MQVLSVQGGAPLAKVMIDDEMGSRSLLQQIGANELSQQGGGDSMTLSSPNRSLPSKPIDKHTLMQRKSSEKSVLDDIMGDPDDFGDIGASDVESDGGRWEDTLREMEQCDTSVEEDLQWKILNPQASFNASINNEEQKLSDPVIDNEHQHMHSGKEETETYTSFEEANYLPTGITRNVAAQHTSAQSTRFFIIKSLNYHNIEKSIQRGIWATQAMNERILNEAFETAERVLLIFSVNMSGHFQGYAQMVSPIGRRRVNVWSEANWGGTFSVEWIRLYDLPFQKTLHLKNPLNSFKPVKISRDCQELTEEIGEALCALLDEGAESEDYAKRKIHFRGDYLTKKPCTERLPFDNGGYFRPVPLRGQMQSVVYPASFLHPLSQELQVPQAPARSPSIKYAGGSSSRSTMHFPGATDINQQEERAQIVSRNGVETSREEDLLNMSYEEYLQCRRSTRESRYHQQSAVGTATSQSVAPFSSGWIGKGATEVQSDDPYASYLASWYASQQSSMMHNGCYQTGPTAASSFRSSSQPP
eukprot:c20443_g1_i1 orf=115-1707(+)